MISLDRYISTLVRENQVRVEDALPFVIDPDMFEGLLR